MAASEQAEDSSQCGDGRLYWEEQCGACAQGKPGKAMVATLVEACPIGRQ